MALLLPFSLFGGGSGAGTASADVNGLIYTANGLKVGSTAILYGNGTQIASVTVDGTGKATWTLGAAPAANTIITFDGVVVGSGGTVPGGPVVAASLGVVKSGNTYTFTVIRTGNTTAAQTVNYNAVGSTLNGADAATASDFGGTLPSGTVTFAANETSKTVTITSNSAEPE